MAGMVVGIFPNTAGHIHTKEQLNKGSIRPCLLKSLIVYLCFENVSPTFEMCAIEDFSDGVGGVCN